MSRNQARSSAAAPIPVDAWPRSHTLQSSEATMLSTWCRGLLESEVPPHERAPLLQSLGIPEEQLLRHDGHVSQRSANALWARLTDDHRDPLFGFHFAERAAVGDIGLVGYLVMSSSSGLAGLERVMKYHRLAKSQESGELRVTARQVHVIENPPPGTGAWPRHLAEAILGAYLVNLKRWSSAEIAPLRASFQHAAPPAASAVGEAFGCAVAFGAAENEIVFPRAPLEAPLRTHDPALCAVLESLADRMLADIPSEPVLLASVRRAVAEMLPSGDLSVERVAAQLALTPRTLQRRLRDFDISFRDLVEDVRREAAERLFRERHVNVTEVAFMLGFSDASSLRRAHRRWRRVSPRVATR